MKKILAIIVVIGVAIIFMGCESGGDSKTDTNIEPIQVNINLYSGNTLSTNEFGEVTEEE